MDHRYGDHFETQIGIADGDYVFGFKVDGRMRVDARCSRHLLLSHEGLFTRRKLMRHSHTVRLTNRGPAGERVRFKTEQTWLTPPAGLIDLPAHSSTQVVVGFSPSLMKAGLNEGTLQLNVVHEELETEIGTVHFSVDAEADVAIPAISLSHVDLGQLRQGMDRAELSVQVTAVGRGPLNGMISLPHSGELTDFHLTAGDQEKASLTHTFQINSSGLPRPQPHQLEAKLRLMVLTDSQVANYRICRAEVTYRLVHLKKSLPALSFGTVRLGGTKVMRLEVRRSDNQSVELQTMLPTNAASYLHVKEIRPDTCDFRFDTTSLVPGTKINETVELIDRNSGLRDQVKVLAAVAGDPLEFNSAKSGPIAS